MKNFTLGTKFLTTLVAVMVSASFTYAQYCIPMYTTGTTEGDFINGVSVGTIANTGTGGAITGVGYSDYTALSTDLTLGTTYTMTVNNNPSWSQTYTAWIDYDGDNTFEVSEVLGNLSLSAGATGTITFTPASGSGMTRMRVRCIYPSGLGTPLDPCASTTYGEAEDYTVNLMDVGAVCATPVGLTAEVFGTEVSMTWTPVPGAQYHLSIYKISDQSLVLKQKVLGGGSGWDYAGLTPGTDYAYHVRAFCGGGMVSGISDNYYFSTPFRLANDAAAINMFPNPNNGTFNLNLSGYENNSYDMNILNSLGQVVYSKVISIDNSSYMEEINLSNVNGGMYIIRLTNDVTDINYSFIVTE